MASESLQNSSKWPSAPRATLFSVYEYNLWWIFLTVLKPRSFSMHFIPLIIALQGYQEIVHHDVLIFAHFCLPISQFHDMQSVKYIRAT